MEPITVGGDSMCHVMGHTARVLLQLTSFSDHTWQV